MAVYDICVVGAGLWGSTAARHASAQRDLKVCLVGPDEPTTQQEFATRDVFGAHYDAGRIYTKVQGTSEVGRVRSTLSERSMARFADLEKKSGVKFYNEVGFVFFGDDISAFDGIVPAGASVETAAAIQNRFPYIDVGGDGPTAILAQHGAGYIDARKYIQAQLMVARRQGCEVVRDVVARVTEVGQSEPRRMLVETDSGTRLYAGKVLLCTGGFTQFKELFPADRQLDAEVTSDVTVRFEIDAECAQKLRHMPCMAAEFKQPSPRECYILPPITYPDGKVYIKIGHGRYIDSTLHTHGAVRAWFVETADQKVVKILKDIFHSVIKGIKPVAEIYNTCADLDTPTELPYCDMVSSGLGILIGGNSMGATVAEEMGRMGADMITGKANWNLDMPKELFQARFVTN